jgi:hypothetical protein
MRCWMMLFFVFVGLMLPAIGWAQESTSVEVPAESPTETAAEAQPAAAPASPPAAAPASPPAAGENSAVTPVVVELKNGLTLTGTIQTSDAISWTAGNPLQFTPINGQATILTAEQIKAVRTVSERPVQSLGPRIVVPKVSDYRSPGGFAYANVGKSRHLYTPSAIAMDQGQGYVSQKGPFTAAAYGVTDNITLLAGTFTFFPPLLTIAGGKVSGEVAKNVHLVAGGEVFITGMGGTGVLAMVAGGGVTFGNEDKQVTFSSGYMRLGSSFGDRDAVPLMVAAQIRGSNRTAFVTENWLVMDLSDDADKIMIISGALRLIGGREVNREHRQKLWDAAGHPKFTWDFGLVAIGTAFQDENDIFEVWGPIPWIDFAWHFGTPDR